MSGWAAARTVVDIAPRALRRHLEQDGGPLVLTGLARGWAASREWRGDGLGRLREHVGEDTAVEVELGRRGRGYLDPQWQRVTMGFGLFLDAFVLQRIPVSDPATAPSGYLAQSPLLDRPALASAVPALEHYTSGPRGDTYARTLWVGPAGSFTPFHRDPNIGLYTQITGTKVFHLLPPQAAAFMRVAGGMQRNTSRCPVSVRSLEGGGERAEVTEEERREWRGVLDEVRQLPGACEATLDEGDSVLIPEGWWHSAEGLSAGVGVNAWFR